MPAAAAAVAAAAAAVVGGGGGGVGGEGGSGGAGGGGWGKSELPWDSLGPQAAAPYCWDQPAGDSRVLSVGFEQARTGVVIVGKMCFV